MLDPKTVPQMVPKALRDGDILLQLPDATSFGLAVSRVASRAAWAKGVPPVMHVLIKTTKDGVPHRLESWFLVIERELKLDPGTYLVLRAATTPSRIDKAIAHGRSQLWRTYGFSNLLRLAGNLFLPRWAQRRVPDATDPVCSQFVGECFDAADYPVPSEFDANGDRDAELKPWDYLTPQVLYLFPLIGRIEV